MDQGSSSPLVSIIVNCYNGEKFLNALNSVLKQTYKNYGINFLG